MNYGGQAVIEGVMMQGPEGNAIAVRTADGNIKTKVTKKKMLREKYPLLGLPLIRGSVSLVDSMATGINMLTWSAAQAGESEEEKLTKKEIAFALIFAAIFSIGLFIVLPVFAASFSVDKVGAFGRSFFEGVLRVGIFLAYVLIVGQMSDMKRLFAYHGAEHKTIAAYEAGEELTPENAMKHSRIHPRCGTSFILMTMLLMILVFTFVGQTTPVKRILIKILCMPIVAGISFELFRLPLKFPNSMIVKCLVAPGLWMQRLTTREPSLDQLEVAIAALTSVPGFVPSYVPEGGEKAEGLTSLGSTSCCALSVQQKESKANKENKDDFIEKSANPIGANPNLHHL